MPPKDDQWPPSPNFSSDWPDDTRSFSQTPKTPTSRHRKLINSNSQSEAIDSRPYVEWGTDSDGAKTGSKDLRHVPETPFKDLQALAFNAQPKALFKPQNTPMSLLKQISKTALDGNRLFDDPESINDDDVFLSKKDAGSESFASFREESFEVSEIVPKDVLDAEFDEKDSKSKAFSFQQSYEVKDSKVLGFVPFEVQDGTDKSQAVDEGFASFSLPAEQASDATESKVLEQGFTSFSSPVEQPLCQEPTVLRMDQVQNERRGSVRDDTSDKRDSVRDDNNDKVPVRENNVQTIPTDPETDAENEMDDDGFQQVSYGKKKRNQFQESVVKVESVVSLNRGFNSFSFPADVTAESIPSDVEDVLDETKPKLLDESIAEQSVPSDVEDVLDETKPELLQESIAEEKVPSDVEEVLEDVLSPQVIEHILNDVQQDAEEFSSPITTVRETASPTSALQEAVGEEMQVVQDEFMDLPTSLQSQTDELVEFLPEYTPLRVIQSMVVSVQDEVVDMPYILTEQSDENVDFMEGYSPLKGIIRSRVESVRDEEQEVPTFLSEQSVEKIGYLEDYSPLKGVIRTKIECVQDEFQRLPNLIPQSLLESVAFIEGYEPLRREIVTGEGIVDCPSETIGMNEPSQSLEKVWYQPTRFVVTKNKTLAERESQAILYSDLHSTLCDVKAMLKTLSQTSLVEVEQVEADVTLVETEAVLRQELDGLKQILEEKKSMREEVYQRRREERRNRRKEREEDCEKESELRRRSVPKEIVVEDVTTFEVPPLPLEIPMPRESLSVFGIKGLSKKSISVIIFCQFLFLVLLWEWSVTEPIVEAELHQPVVWRKWLFSWFNDDENDVPMPY
jgi:hypothetical protein